MLHINMLKYITKFNLQMMHVLESLIQSEEYSYLRMDGITSMSQRQETIRLFNKVFIYIYIYNLLSIIY